MPANQPVNFSLNIPVFKIHQALKWVVILNIVLLFGTWLSHSGNIMPGKYTVQVLLAQFNFAKENVAAAWYSSMLFFMSGLIAATCFWADMRRSENAGGRILNFGWLVIAGIFIMLSFDEMGSFHEMIGETAMFKKAGGGSKSAGWYFFYGLIGAVAIFMITFFVLKFKGNKLAFILTVVGVLLFISNPFQEKFEIHTWRSSVDPAHWHRPAVFLLLEEGSEIFASFCFLYSFTTYAIGAAPGSDAANGQTLRLSSLLPRNFILYILGLAGLLGVIMLVIHLNAWNFSRDDNGIPHDWPPAAVSFLGFAAAIFLYYKFDDTRYKMTYLIIAFCSLIISVYFGSDIYDYHSGAFGKLKYAMLAITLAGGMWSILKLDDPLTRVLLACWTVLMSATVFTHRFYPAALGYLGAVALVVGLYVHFRKRAANSALN